MNPPDQYTIIHMHSDLSNATTVLDSVTKFHCYIDQAKICGMKAMAFTEHGSLFEWWHKKCAIEAAGMKYIHGVEAYITQSLTEKIRDNYHCILLAKNYDGFLELNRMVSQSFNRNDGHFYYTPRISMDELFATSDNIIVTTACIGGVFGKGSDEVQSRMLEFMIANKARCFFEIGHHLDDKQRAYNIKMLELSRQTGIPLVVGTDTHVLDERHEKGRLILQAAKDTHFDDEDQWDLKFKTLDQLIRSFEYQGALDEDVYLQAIENTNRIADMVEPFVLDRNTKYPHIYKDPEETFARKIEEAVANHPIAGRRHDKQLLLDRAHEELDVYKKTGSIDFMLLQTYLRDWEKENGIHCGPGRGSVSGSMIAYLLGITQMDSMKFDLNFFRFLNPSRVTNADIDTDYANADRDKVKYFLLHDRMNLPQIKTAEIITFNTIALKGAIRDVGRAMQLPLQEVSSICAQLDGDEVPIALRRQYPQLFEYVDIVNGTIVSIGTHPSGVLVSDLPIDETVGLCSIASSDYPVSMINMKELDDLMYVKLDILGLDNVGVINETCNLLGIEPLTPDTVDLEDLEVWRSIRDDTTLIFQWESNSAQAFLRKFMSDATLAKAMERSADFSMIKWLSFGNGLIRPACASFRDSVANGEFYDNGFEALNHFLSKEAGRIAMQETIMKFLVEFCGYTQAESDNVRRAIAKKKGTETLLPEIKQRFIDYASEHYPISKERCAEVIEPFIQVILDASAYAFSWNHSDSYSIIGYICGYLRYYYPLEFLTAALNIFGDNTEKTAEIIKYGKRHGIMITLPKFGASKNEYYFNAQKKNIAKGIGSIKYMSKTLGDDLYALASSRSFGYFVDLLSAMDNLTINSRQLEILIKIDFFSEFGNQRELLWILDMFNYFKGGTAKKIDRASIAGSPFEHVVDAYSTATKKDGTVAKHYTILEMEPILHGCEDIIRSRHVPDIEDYIKAQSFAEAMGYYGYTSGKEEDRKKLFVRDVFPVKRKSDGKQFGYSVLTQSLGSGVEARFTVYTREYDKHPIHKGDIIFCDHYVRKGQYFDLMAYRHLYSQIER